MKANRMPFYICFLILIGFNYFKFIESTCPYIRCKKSTDCPSGQCCRANDGSVLVSNTQLGKWPPPFPENDPTEGICSPIIAQLDELCDESCPCTENLQCFRQPSGICCPPLRCFTLEYVNQTQNCFPPDCEPPQ